jgi:hypothetical protein
MKIVAIFQTQTIENIWENIQIVNRQLQKQRERILNPMDAEHALMNVIPLRIQVMGFRFQKRIKLGGGLGLNISKSGISPSLRTKAGTISNKGFSVRTGVPGASYRKSFNTSKSSGCLFAFIMYLGLGVYFINSIIKKNLL